MAAKLLGLSVYTRVPKFTRITMSLTLFVLVIGGYLLASFIRHIGDPNDLITPNIPQIIGGMERALTPDSSGNIPLVADTLVSLQRFALGVIIGSVFGIFLGLYMGVFPFVEALLLYFMRFAGNIPGLILIPILVLISGVGEETKLILIVGGIMPSIAINTYNIVKKVPLEVYVKALSMAASKAEVVHSIILPLIMPAALNIVRTNLLTAWLFLIAGEALASAAGLGFRIFVSKRSMGFDLIYPYVIWITLLSLAIDIVVAWAIKKKYRWYERS